MTAVDVLVAVPSVAQHCRAFLRGMRRRSSKTREKPLREGTVIHTAAKNCVQTHGSRREMRCDPADRHSLQNEAHLSDFPSKPDSYEQIFASPLLHELLCRHGLHLNSVPALNIELTLKTGPVRILGRHPTAGISSLRVLNASLLARKLN